MPDRGSGGRVASLVAAAVSVYALPPTAADFAACNADAQVAVKAGTASPTTMDYVRVESARTDSAATWSAWVGAMRRGDADPQRRGRATGGSADAACQAGERVGMRRSRLREIERSTARAC